MKIKDWLKENRNLQKLTLTELSLKVGMSHGQLSRMETGSSSLTLFSTVRIMHVLNLSWSSLFSEGLIDEQVRRLPTLYYKDSKSSNFECINFNDVEALITSGLITRGIASTVITELIKMFVGRFVSRLSENNLSYLSTSLYSFLGDASIQSIQGLPKELAGISFTYPMELDLEKLREVYLAGGVFIMQDLSFYIKQLRASRNISLRKQSQALEMTHPALRALETRMNERVKLQDIINLDKQLELGGELIVFAWRTAELYLGIHRPASTTERKILYPLQGYEVQVIEKLIVLSRLFLHYFPTDLAWLKWYRQQSLIGFVEFA